LAHSLSTADFQLRMSRLLCSSNDSYRIVARIWSFYPICHW